MHFGAAISLLHEIVTHRKEVADVADETIKFLLRVERSCVHHKTDADTYASYAEKGLAEYLGKQPLAPAAPPDTVPGA